MYMVTTLQTVNIGVHLVLWLNKSLYIFITLWGGIFGSNLKIERIRNNWVLKIVTVAAKCDFKHYVNIETP